MTVHFICPRLSLAATSRKSKGQKVEGFQGPSACFMNAAPMTPIEIMQRKFKHAQEIFFRNDSQ